MNDSARRRISAIYLLDAAAELALVAAWIISARRPRAASTIVTSDAIGRSPASARPATRVS